MEQQPLNATCVLRKLDDLGRVVLPIEIRKGLNLSPRDLIEIYVDGETIMLRKFEPACVFCGSLGNAQIFRGKLICNKCFEEIQNKEKEF